MEELERRKIIEIIRTSIDEVVHDEIKKRPEQERKRQEEFTKTKAQREQDAHDAIFGKEDEEMSYKLRLHESEEIPKITANELEQFEKEFKSRFPNIIFDKQTGIGKNGQIVDFPVKNGQKDAISSGRISIGKESIGFSMSLSDGFKIRSLIESGKPKMFKITSETKDVFGKLLNLYEEIFSKRFNEIINSDEDDLTNPTTEQNPFTAPTLNTVQTPAPTIGV